jgi:uncharacterized protein YndB with AHSA1/START domain
LQEAVVEQDLRELGTIEREIFVEASPAVVFEVVSSPEHVRQWWPEEADYAVEPGASGHISFGGQGTAGEPVALSVLEVDPPRTFSFRWTHPAGEVARVGNSLLVTFALTAQGSGTLLRMTETGFREMGWEAATLEAHYDDHATGWDHFLPRIAPYVASLDPRP